MSKSFAHLITLNPPIMVLGKYFLGDYSSFRAYYDEVRQILIGEKVAFVPDKSVGIYYDNPNDTHCAELRSFHGVIPSSPDFSSSLSVELLTGDYLTVTIDWPTMKTIYEGYKSIIDYLNNNRIRLRSNIGYQILTNHGSEFTMELYIEVNPDKT